MNHVEGFSCNNVNYDSAKDDDTPTRQMVEDLRFNLNLVLNVPLDPKHTGP